MPFPNQTFNSLAQLINYINTKIYPNGQQEIDGEAMNNVLNGLCNFIPEYTVNAGLGDVEGSSGQVIVVDKPITVFTGAPTSVQWDGNVQNEYYFVNSTGYNIPLTAGFSYIDAYENEKTIIPARFSVHIAKMPNGGWVQINNLGGGGSAGLPPEAGNSGKFLATNGTTPFWMGAHKSITQADFSSAKECPLPELAPFSFSIYWSDLANFIYADAGQWAYLPGGGFEILIPGFDATGSNCNFELFLKPL